MRGFRSSTLIAILQCFYETEITAITRKFFQQTFEKSLIPHAAGQHAIDINSSRSQQLSYNVIHQSFSFLLW